MTGLIVGAFWGAVLGLVLWLQTMNWKVFPVSVIVMVLFFAVFAYDRGKSFFRSLQEMSGHHRHEGGSGGDGLGDPGGGEGAAG